MQNVSLIPLCWKVLQTIMEFDFYIVPFILQVLYRLSQNAFQNNEMGLVWWVFKKTLQLLCVQETQARKLGPVILT